nr:E3 ubiquitin-protein ligase MIB2-like [Lytechinus pictus]
MSIELGTRVVRGPDWKWDDQDRGEGHVGTVVYIGKGDPVDRPEKTVLVMWDLGRKNNYRAGFNRAFDLRIFDNAQTGVVHPDVSCIVCNEKIHGIRWKCIKCFNCNLCIHCFMYDKHDISHPFQRFTTKDSAGRTLYCRYGCRKVEAFGTFPGASVQRGNDWKYGDQDGGDSSRPGTMVDIQGWGDDGNRAGVGVRWPGKSKLYRYRLGYEGKVDVKCVQEAQKGTYYPELLPNLGETEDLQVGDTVVIQLSKDTLKSLGDASIGVSRQIHEVAGEKGVIKTVTNKGELGIQYLGGQVFFVNPLAVQKVSAFNVGDRVRIITDQLQAENLQRGHGGWNQSMRKILGREACVEQIYSDGDIKVKIEATSIRLLFHPACLTLVEPGQHEAVFEQEPGDGFLSLLDQQKSMGVQSDQANKRRFSKAAAMGRVSEVKIILEVHPDMIDSLYSNRTALQVAAHQGHLSTVKELMKYRPSLEAVDNDGDTALLYAVYGDKPVMVEYLLDKGCYINVVNKQRRSCLHVAARRGHVRCVEILLKRGCQCNAQDKAGDLALHDAIHKDKREVIDVLVPWPKCDLTLRNKKNLSVLHYAALRGNDYAAERLVSHAPHLLKLRRDGETALHVAASNNFEKVARCLIEKDRSILDDRNSQQKTPLSIAVSGGHVSIVKLLVEAGADVNASDADGDTCLHIAVLRYKHNPSESDASAIQPLCKGVDDSLLKTPGVPLIVYLIQNGARIDIYNRTHKKPLQLVENSGVLKALNGIEGNPVSVPAPVDEGDGFQVDSASRVFNLKSKEPPTQTSPPASLQQPQSLDQPQQPQQQPRSRLKLSMGQGKPRSLNQLRENLLPRSPRSPPISQQPPQFPRAFEGVHRIDVNELDLGVEIGGGSFARVYRGRWRGTTVAIKKMNIAGSKRAEIEKEVDIHKQAMHPNIVQLMALGYSDVSAYLVMTFIHGSTLHQYIFPGEKTKSSTLTVPQKNEISKAVLSALTFMHASGLLHLDIKPTNILIEKGTLKTYLCDLGLSYIKQRAHMSLSSHLSKARGTPMYMAPEMHADHSLKVSSAQDVWSVACTFIELYGEVPFIPPTMTMWGLVRRFFSGRIIPDSLEEVGMPQKAIINPCFTNKTSARPMTSELLRKFEDLCEES